MYVDEEFEMPATTRNYVIRVLQRNHSTLNPVEFKAYLLKFCEKNARRFEERPPEELPLIAETFRPGPPIQMLVYARVESLKGQPFKERVQDDAQMDDHIEKIEVNRCYAPINSRIGLDGVFQ